MSLGSRFFFALVGLFALLPGGTPPAAASAGGGAVTPVPPSRAALDAARDRARFAFRPRAGGAFGTTTGTYAVEVEGGVVRVAPIAGRERRGRALELRTERFSRASVQGGALAPAARLGEDGALALGLDDAIEERLVNGPEGVEQSWLVRTLPSGEGDLVVRIRASGLSFAGATDEGLHFADPASGLHVRYGHATFIDARGVRTELPSRFARGAIELRVPADVIDDATFPAVLDPTIGPELGIGEPIQMRPYPSHTEERVDREDVACTATTCLAVWTEGQWGLFDVHGARFRVSDGALLDPIGIVLADALEDEAVPAVATDGSRFLVAWAERTEGTSLTLAIHATRVDASGPPLDATPITLASSLGYFPAIACGSGQCLVTYTAGITGTPVRVRGNRVRLSDGAVLDPLGISIATADGLLDTVRPDVAFDGTSYLVVYEDDPDDDEHGVYGVRVRASDGAILDPSGFAVASVGADVAGPRVAFGGGVYLVAFAQRAGSLVSAPGAHLRAVRVTPAGIPLDPAEGIEIIYRGQANDAYGWDGEPELYFAASRFHVVWGDTYGTESSVFVRRVAPDGTFADEAPIAMDPRPSGAIATAGARIVHFGGGLARRFSAADLAPLDAAPRPIANMANRQLTPNVAVSGTTALIVYRDSRTGHGDELYATRVRTTDGAVLDPEGILVAGGDGERLGPNVVAAGGVFLVGYLDRDRVEARCQYSGVRIDSTDGSVLDDAPIRFGECGEPPFDDEGPALATDGTSFLAVYGWLTQLEGPYTYKLHAVRIDAAGEVLDPEPIRVSYGSGTQRRASVAFSRSSYLVTWADGRDGAHSRSIYGARISPDGTLLDGESGFRIFGPVGGTYSEIAELDLAAGDDGYALAFTQSEPEYLRWEDWIDGDAHVRAQRLGADGRPVGSVLTLSEGTPRMIGYVTLANDGAGYVAAWHEDHEDGTAALRGRGFTADGALREASPFTIQEDIRTARTPYFALPQRYVPDLAGTGDGRAMLAYDRPDVEPAVRNLRVFTRFLTADAGGGGGGGSGAGGCSGNTTPTPTCSARDAGSPASALPLVGLATCALLLAARRRRS